jgi:hypothetical protein
MWDDPIRLGEKWKGERSRRRPLAFTRRFAAGMFIWAGTGADMRRSSVILGLAIVGLGAVAALALGWQWLRSAKPPAWSDDYDVTAKPPESITPGIVVERSAPAGWSHLVIKSLPRVRPSEVPRVPAVPVLGRDYTVRMVSWMFTAFVADVVPEQDGSHTRYRLRAIGLGLGTNVNGKDTVITRETAKQYDVELNWITKEILETGYRVQSQARLVLHGPSFALLDTPVWLRCNSKNKLVRYRYALFVDAATGRLDVLLWVLGGENGECADLTQALLLPPDLIDEVELVPDPAEFDRGIARESAFGVDGLPLHRAKLTIPPELRELAGKTRFTPDDARALEDGLRRLLPDPRP